MIVSGEKLIYDNNDKLFEFTTPSVVENRPNQKPAFGKVFDAENKPLENVLILLSINEYKKVGALSTKNGEWLVPLNFILDNNLNQQTLTQDEIVKIDMFNDFDALKTHITANISALSPLDQPIIIGNNYELLSKDDVLGLSTGGSVTLDSIDFIYPKVNSIIPASRPLIKGVALANSNIKLIIQGQNINKSYNLKSNSEGQWTLSSISSLPPGKYTTTIISNNEKGNEVEKKRSFTIAKSGEQVLGESTPSAIMSTPEPTESPTLEPTAIPTQSAVSPSPTIPASGNSAMYMWIASIALVIVGFSLVFLFPI
jgi:hypothetical protein